MAEGSASGLRGLVGDPLDGDNAPGPGEPELVDTGNFPGPDDGPQDDIEQSSLPDFDEDLIDGAHLEDDE